MAKRIFKRLGVENIRNPLDAAEVLFVRRWKALTDIPEFNILKGSVTGHIDARIKPPKGDVVMWVDKDALLLGAIDFDASESPSFNGMDHFAEPEPVSFAVLDQSTVIAYPWESDQTVTFSGRFRIEKSASLVCCNIDLQKKTVISKDIVITDNAVVNSPTRLSGCITISGQSRIGDFAQIFGHVSIGDNVEIGTLAHITGEALMEDNVIVESNVMINDKVRLSGNVRIPSMTKIIHGETSIQVNIDPIKASSRKAKLKDLPSFASPLIDKDEEIPATTTETLAIKSAADVVNNRRQALDEKLEAVKAKIDAYHCDIVKIIKYPVMVDLTDPHTADMMFALHDVEDAMDYDTYASAIKLLERKFMIAESNARKIVDSEFNEEQRKKAVLAQDLFSLACDEATSEHEKKNALVKGFKNLEGIIAVPDQAVDAMKVKVGIAEIMM